MGKDIVASAQAIWHGIVNAFNAVVDFFKKYGVIIGESLLALFAPVIGLPLIIITHWKTISAFFGVLWGDLTKWAKKIWSDVAGFFSGLFNSVSNAAKAWFTSQVNGWKNLWGDIAGFAKRIWNDVTNFFSNLWAGLKKKASQGWQDEVQGWKNIYNDVVGLAKRLWLDVTNFFSNLWAGLKKKAQQGWQDEVQGWKNIWNSVTSTAKSIWNSVSGFFQNLWHDLVKFATNIRDDVVRKFNDLKNGLSQIFKDIANTVFVAPINFIISTVIDKGVGGLLPDLGKVFGKNWSIQVPTINKFAQGGPVPGSGNTDNQLILATPGEWVLSKAQVASLGGIPNIAKAFGNGGPSN